MGVAMMGEHILKLGVGELQTARLTCQVCHATAEVAIEDLGVRFQDCRCPFCQAPYLAGGAVNPNPFERLRTALKSVREASNLKFEFVIPADPA
jgi:hypothetical protein